MRSDLDFAFLTRESGLGFNHDFELGTVLALVVGRISLKLIRNNFAAHMLFPNKIRETFAFV